MNFDVFFFLGGEKGEHQNIVFFLVKEWLIIQMNPQSEKETTQKLEIFIPPTREQQKPLIWTRFQISCKCC